MDAGAVGGLVAGYPLQLVPAGDARLLGTVDWLMDHARVRGGFFQDMIHLGDQRLSHPAPGPGAHRAPVIPVAMSSSGRRRTWRTRHWPVAGGHPSEDPRWLHGRWPARLGGCGMGVDAAELLRARGGRASGACRRCPAAVVRRGGAHALRPHSYPLWDGRGGDRAGIRRPRRRRGALGGRLAPPAAGGGDRPAEPCGTDAVSPGAGRRNPALEDGGVNILMMTNTYLPRCRGRARSVASFTRAYRDRGHRVLVVAPEFAGTAEDEADVVRMPALQNFNGSDFSVVLPVPRFLEREVTRFEPDIIHSHHPFLIGSTALRLASLFGLPLVFTHHTMYERYTHYVPGDSAVLRRFVVQLSTSYANPAIASSPQ
ncbi:MAG: glycosyltransferase [Arhodomonas sp.]|nr:glycosyltransferase [Arhodomonas sp.]